MSYDEEGAAFDDGADDAVEVGEDNQFVTFTIDGEVFAAPMGPVQEIIRVPDLARVPLAPASLLGLANLRGRILPIVSLRRIFGLPPAEDTDQTRALVIDFGSALGFVVDHVASVIAVDKDSIEPASAIRATIDTALLTGVVKGRDGEMIMIIDFSRLIDTEFAGIAEMAAGRSANALAQSAKHGAMADTLDAPAEERVSDELQLVSFTVDGQEYAAPIEAVQEIVQVPERTVLVPNTAGHVLGLITLRERLLPLVSLRAMLGLVRIPADESQRIVVLGLADGQSVGVVADSVDEVLRVPLREVEMLPGILARGSGSEDIASVCRLDGGKRLVSVLDTARLFDRGELQALSHDLARREALMTDDRRRGDEDEEGMEDEEQVVVFRLGSEEYGAPISAVQEIVRVPEQLTHVPKAPHFVEGVINLRGAVLPVIDQRRRLGLEELERNDRQRVMVYQIEGMRTGFIVDSVSEVLKIPRGSIETAPRLSGEQSRILGRMANLEAQKRIILLLDPCALLSDDEVLNLSAM